MSNIKIFKEYTSSIAAGQFDLAVVSYNNNLEVSCLHKSIPQTIISNRHYLLKELHAIRTNYTQIDSEDIFIVRNEELEKSDIMYAVLALVSDKNQEKN